ncbi:MAG: flavin monoamine oxidase family protein [Eubacteriales bacterium]
MNLRVLVVGAGLAGLTAAYKLAGLGVNILVLEKENYAGGRVKSDSCQGLALDSGAQFIGGMYHRTHSLLRETGLNRCLAPIKAAVDVIGDGSRYSLCRHTLARPYPCFDTLTWRKKLAVLKLALFLRSHRNKIDISNLAAGVELDDISFGKWAEDFLCPELVRQYLNPVTASLFFQPAGDISRLVPLTLIRSPHRCKIHSLDGGLGSLPETMAKKVPVLKNTRVLRTTANFTNNTVSVEVSLPNGKKETLSANRVVFAIPPQELLAVLDDPQKSVGSNGLIFLRSSRFVSVSVTGLVIAAPISKGLYGYVFQPGEHGLTSVSFGRGRSYKSGSANTVTIISSGGETPVIAPPGSEQDSHSQNPETGTDLLLSAERFFPGLAQKIIERKDYNWKYAIPCFPPGRVREIVKFQETPRPSKLFAFCGDYLGGPGIEGAVVSGLTAADQIISSIS